ncbi:MAG: stress response translation initiation inhibitor YciH [Deltaproteobacteria bacterium]|nr:stress response translation initiation inhibitor YciH [Deltaproteobacteria bacterium]
MSNDVRPVYSTEHGSLCPGCGKNPCACRPAPLVQKGPVRVGRETKGRKGAGVTVVSGLALPEAELKNLLARWKKRLGCGGTCRDGMLEFQGEHRDALMAELKAMGIAAKKSGG